MAINFLKKVVAELPEIVGETVYFSHAELPAEMPCIINGDATLSFPTEPEITYAQPRDIIMAVFGEAPWRNIHLGKNLFLHPDRKSLLRSLIEKKKKESGEKYRLQQCPGFMLETWYLGESSSSKRVIFLKDFLV